MSRINVFENSLFENQLVRRAGRLAITALAAGALVCGAENTKKPISRERVFKAVEIGGLSTDEFIGIIKDFGVEFELNAEDRQNLAKAGVEPNVVAAIGANYRDPIKDKITQLTQGGPLAKDNIIGLLKAGAGSDIIEVLVDKRGISFAMTPPDAKEIETAGGSKGLLGALLLKEPVKVAAAPAPVAAREPVLVASSTPASVILPQETVAAKVAAPAQSAPAAAQAIPAPVAAPPVAAPATATPAQPINQAAAMLTSSAKPAKLLKGGVQYTEMARRVHAVGRVMMEIVINEQGKVERVKGLSGNPLLIIAASQSMKEWLYEPATVDGRPTKVSTQVSVDFQ